MQYSSYPLTSLYNYDLFRHGYMRNHSRIFYIQWEPAYAIFRSMSVYLQRLHHGLKEKILLDLTRGHYKEYALEMITSI